MSDAVFFALAGLVAAVVVALALVWPQGLGARSPGPFGHAVTMEPAAAAAQAMEAEAAARAAAQAGAADAGAPPPPQPAPPPSIGPLKGSL